MSSSVVDHGLAELRSGGSILNLGAGDPDAISGVVAKLLTFVMVMIVREENIPIARGCFFVSPLNYEIQLVE